MSIIKEYFINEFSNSFSALPISYINSIQEFDHTTNKLITYEIDFKVIINIWSGARMFMYYIPITNSTFSFIKLIVDNYQKEIEKMEEISINYDSAGQQSFGRIINSYSNCIYFYTENELNEDGIKELDILAKNVNLNIVVRSQKYIKHAMKNKIPLAFISHDSRDKEEIARVIAFGLSSRLCTVWYDEFSLNVGQSLRESIEKGIKESKKCILIITPNYLSNPGWGKKEFNSIFTRELIENEKIILPIWYKVSAKEVYEYSPSLADTFALSWPDPNKLSDEEYKKSIELIISKIHTHLS